ncbi:phosphatidylinositol synthase 1 (CDP-alcohol phosphatidyltransferase1) [Fusarium equiseti]|uniref:Phosphatidylinositol synthase 1 (CDP-alcohol phosphatidyltransferase1) n=1 Tax=Fusarium equiseti TaxID=61235 RepID=A0ABQ8RIJ0_FUSEQ|nr:phosphatidylinositol synthase 1 (CDP-alcohol phosphatidyltransferase1) [Fusarium equiseti]
MGARTRRQAAKAQGSSSDSEPEVKSNGNGVARDTADASDAAPRENIFLFYPNIIGYARIVLAIASLYYMPLHPRTCSFLYSVSCLLDALDGYAARIYEQSTRFGAVLDMVTDRCTTACLIVFLSSAFPRWAIVFQGLIALDLASHYMHMYATLVVSGSNASHKNIDESKNWLLRLYYTNKGVLFTLCALNELFFIALYLLCFSSPLVSPYLIKPIETVGAELQAGAQVNTSILAQIFPDPFSPAALELARANKMDSTVPWAIAGISFPFMFMKQFINCVQLYNASQALAEIDLKTRREQGLPRPKPKKA